VTTTSAGALAPDIEARPGTPRRRPGLRARLIESRLGEILTFGVIGAVNTIVDIGLFNVLLWWVLPGQPLVDKGLSITVATVSAYVMNRNLTWADRARTGLRRELPLFALLSLIGLGISEATLALSHYGLGYTSALADNISANVIGLVLASLWRFWSFRRWVFLVDEPPAVEPFPDQRDADVRVA
jgi:putative flippase GtrA